MIDRRGMIASGMAVAVAGAARAAGHGGADDARLAGLALPPGFQGMLALGRAGHIVAARPVGMADIEAGRPVSADTRFRWGSATKWLVSTAVLRLHEQGRLSLDAPVARYLPDLRPDDATPVLVRHLLSNTSGIPDLLSRQVGQEPELRTSRAPALAIARRFAGAPLSFVPGTGWDYAALNWVIVAALTQQVTGEPLIAAVQRLGLDPLRLRSTGFAQADQPDMPALAAAYGTVDPPERKMAPVPPFLAASGTVAGTAADAVRAAHGIFHGALLDAASRQELTRIHWADQDYALGGRVRVIGGTRYAWEAGKVGGYRALIAHRLDRSETIVVFNTTDLDQAVISALAEDIARA